MSGFFTAWTTRRPELDAAFAERTRRPRPRLAQREGPAAQSAQLADQWASSQNAFDLVVRQLVGGQDRDRGQAQLSCRPQPQMVSANAPLPRETIGMRSVTSKESKRKSRTIQGKIKRVSMFSTPNMAVEPSQLTLVAA
jgi:hypothetical protein